MYRAMSPGKMAFRDFLRCLVICAVVINFDHDAVRNPVRLAIMLFIIIAVPVGNFFLARRRARTEMEQSLQ